MDRARGPGLTLTAAGDAGPPTSRRERRAREAARAEAALSGRDYVVPDDVRAVAHVVLAHRLLLDGPVRHDTTSPQARRIVIIGGGNIGLHVSRELERQGSRVRAKGRKPAMA